MILPSTKDINLVVDGKTSVVSEFATSSLACHTPTTIYNYYLLVGYISMKGRHYQ